jgi:hypothetical protein
VSPIDTAGDAFDFQTPITGSWLVVPARDDRRPSIESAGWSWQSTAFAVGRNVVPGLSKDQVMLYRCLDRNA